MCLRKLVNGRLNRVFAALCAEVSNADLAALGQAPFRPPYDIKPLFNFQLFLMPYKWAVYRCGRLDPPVSAPVLHPIKR